MNILLYLKDNIMTFKLPIEISGSYSFYALENDSSLINVDSDNDNWYLIQSNDVKIVNGNEYVERVLLKKDCFYVLENDKQKYLLYVEGKSLDNFVPYEYDLSNPLVISNKEGANIVYKCPIYKTLDIQLYKRSDNLYIKKDNNNVYRNKSLLISVETPLSSGDEIEIYGLRLLVVNNKIFVNKNSRFSTTMTMYNLPSLSDYEAIEIIDKPLYRKDDYYNKAPRIRRRIEEEVIKIDKPPSFGNQQDMPLLLTIGPMITMGATSALTLVNVLMQISNGTTTWAAAWPQVATSIAMIMSMFLWPSLIRHFNRKNREENEYKTSLKFAKYFDEKKEELTQIALNQSIILNENLITVDECIKIINQKQIGFWDKRLDQDDFLEVRLGMGRQKLRCRVEYPEEGFTMDDSELKRRTNELVEQFKYIENVPASYSFSKNKLTAIMGNRNIQINFLNNILLQLITFYNYDDLKIVVITNEENKNDFNYIKYLNHNFSNNKQVRYFASDIESAKNICNQLSAEVSNRTVMESKTPFKPYYFVIVDDYESIKHYDLIDTVSESEKDLGFSFVFLENRMSNLPSKCNNFITMDDKKSNILINAFEEQEQDTFINEIHYNIDMMAIAKSLSNIPVQLNDEESSLPEAITFLEMEKCGKVDQLNVLNRWLSNDPTRSLRAEVGVDASGSLMFLDLHEKFHGPHGLIAGMTGSGKSEFIITYILSMAINYSPNEVSFILIDYKGGGLAGAFENETTGIRLPHLAGTITNLDKAEMDRTLVSINSELERRQRLFNEARDTLGESTMDIYKYQSCFRDGKLKEPIPHLFIICDEFAELKSQQPDFMDSLISTARIGRSLGVHLILATQKPSGVVNDQIWSNTKFRVCLKVQDASDSKEMLKKNDAASLKQTGRFYLQVGYDEYYALGQSAWCGAKYFPSDAYIKQVDKSINFIDNLGYKIKNISESNGKKVAAQGEQITAILKHIMQVAQKENLYSKRLWLDNIPANILVDKVKEKYNVLDTGLNAVIGEYDAPELQKQGVVTFNYESNTLIYGLDGLEKELFLNTLVYSTINNYDASKINYYFVDYGSESLKKYQGAPQVGGIVYSGEEEKFNNLLKMLKEELSNRKKLFVDYGGEYKNYAKTHNDLPIISVIFNNYDSIYEANQNLYEELPELVRDSNRYGIVFIMTCNGMSSVANKISQNFDLIYAFHLKDESEYTSIFNIKLKNAPRDVNGRGILELDGALHEFQVAHIVDEGVNESEFMVEKIKKLKENSNVFAKRIPVLPDVVRLSDIDVKNFDIKNIPIGITKKNLDIAYMDYSLSVGNVISTNRLSNAKNFVLSLLDIFRRIPNYMLLIVDGNKDLNLDKSMYPNYCSASYDKYLDILLDYVQKLIDKNGNISGTLFIYGFTKFMNTVDKTKFTNLIDLIKKYEKLNIVIVEDAAKLKAYAYETWFSSTFSVTDGIWVGKGISDQSLFRLTTVRKEMLADIKNDMGYVINESSANLCRLIDFVSEGDKDE